MLLWRSMALLSCSVRLCWGWGCGFVTLSFSPVSRSRVPQSCYLSSAIQGQGFNTSDRFSFVVAEKSSVWHVLSVVCMNFISFSCSCTCPSPGDGRSDGGLCGVYCGLCWVVGIWAWLISSVAVAFHTGRGEYIWTWVSAHAPQSFLSPVWFGLVMNDQSLHSATAWVLTSSVCASHGASQWVSFGVDSNDSSSVQHLGTHMFIKLKLRMSKGSYFLSTE